MDSRQLWRKLWQARSDQLYVTKKPWVWSRMLSMKLNLILKEQAEPSMAISHLLMYDWGHTRPNNSNKLVKPSDKSRRLMPRWSRWENPKTMREVSWQLILVQPMIYQHLWETIQVLLAQLKHQPKSHQQLQSLLDRRKVLLISHHSRHFSQVRVKKPIQQQSIVLLESLTTSHITHQLRSRSRDWNMFGSSIRTKSFKTREEMKRQQPWLESIELQEEEWKPNSKGEKSTRMMQRTSWGLEGS